MANFLASIFGTEQDKVSTRKNDQRSPTVTNVMVVC